MFVFGSMALEIGESESFFYLSGIKSTFTFLVIVSKSESHLNRFIELSRPPDRISEIFKIKNELGSAASVGLKKSVHCEFFGVWKMK